MYVNAIIIINNHKIKMLVNSKKISENSLHSEVTNIKAGLNSLCENKQIIILSQSKFVFLFSK
jgi:predicted ATPase